MTRHAAVEPGDPVPYRDVDPVTAPLPVTPPAAAPGTGPRHHAADPAGEPPTRPIPVQRTPAEPRPAPPPGPAPGSGPPPVPDTTGVATPILWAAGGLSGLLAVGLVSTS